MCARAAAAGQEAGGGGARGGEEAAPVSARAGRAAADRGVQRAGQPAARTCTLVDLLDH